MDARNSPGGIASHIEFTELVLPNCGQVIRCDGEQRSSRKSRAGLREYPHSSADEVAENISTGEARHFRAVIDMTADYGVVTLAVVVVENRQSESGHRAARGRRKAVGTFHNVPTEIGAALRGGQMVDFLEIVLAYVADPKIAGHGIKRKAERIAQTEKPNFRAAAARRERIARRNRVIQPGGMGGVDVDAEHFAEECIRVLPICERISAAAAVAEADIEETVFAEGESSTVVIGERLINGEKNIFGGWVGEVCVGGGGGEFGNDSLQLRRVETQGQGARFRHRR